MLAMKLARGPAPMPARTEDTAVAACSTAKEGPSMGVSPIRPSRLIERWEVAITRPALERAGWACDSCRDDSNLRVIDDRGQRLVVLCTECRLLAGLMPGD
jgi:hypothetical protein